MTATDQPRQRTVAELLAEHGGSGASSPRRRRREPDDAPDIADALLSQAPARPLVQQRSAPPAEPIPVARDQRSPVGYRGFAPAGDDGGEAAPGARRRSFTTSPDVAAGPLAPPVSPPPPAAPAAQPVPRSAPPASLPPPASQPPVRRPEFSTDVMARIVSPAPGFNEAATGPIPRITDDFDPAGPATGPIAVADALNGYRSPTTGAPADGGPPTQYAPGVIDDDPDVDDADHDDAAAEDEWADDEWADDDADLDEHTDHDDDERSNVDTPDDDYDDELDDVDERPQRRRSREKPASSGPAWAAVVAQWIAGAVAGAALWVGFRYLWRGLPIVAVVAAVVVTVGLVVIVRTLLRNSDIRTTIFAVLVGLLLTVSPAILVLLGR